MPSSEARLRHILLALLLIALPSAAVAIETREILATGDHVPRFGRIGLWGVELRGIDDRGRVLIDGQVSAGLLAARSRRSIRRARNAEVREHPPC
jgi:hypothetical protein